MALILIVDDEPHIVTIASFALNRAGYKTIGATSAKQALELWTPEVDLLLTDCVMPDLFGDQLAARLKEQKPSLKVIFMSGNSIGSLELGVPLEEGLNFVQKPFDYETLVSAVRSAMANGNSSKLAKS
jgi:two-component system, cell cycle sensor histidine kinase and response regulator CckA